MGVPEIVAVLLPLLVKLTPAGSVPLRVTLLVKLVGPPAVAGAELIEHVPATNDRVPAALRPRQRPVRQAEVEAGA